jgi:hypothetical protein
MAPGDVRVMNRKIAPGNCQMRNNVSLKMTGNSHGNRTCGEDENGRCGRRMSEIERSDSSARKSDSSVRLDSSHGGEWNEWGKEYEERESRKIVSFQSPGLERT